ncbi:hypothetical protein, partial [Streptomyces erythrochromogenes]|uniref:hypothetical protein n=1 Tax=Streptomyces erythrochromogenes TaxID=285574 RepID=UPI0036BB68D0
MDREQVIGVRRAGGGPGSGYLVGPDLALTSAHVVGPVGDMVSLFRPGRAGMFQGRVVWRGTPGGRDDAALVKVTSVDWSPAAGRPVRWGHLVTGNTSECVTCGLPEAFQQPDYAETAQPTGKISVGDRSVGNRYVMQLNHPLGAGSHAAGSPWGGLSGAALFSGDLLIGVIAMHPAADRSEQLEAVPVYILMCDDGFLAALDAHLGPPPGHARVSSERLHPVEWQKIADTAALAAAGSAPSPSPAALLLARNAVVPFRGRERELESLTDWARRPGFGAQLVHGPGGQGKTRLAHRLGARLGVDGHVVLWPGARVLPTDLVALKDSTRPLLVVVDYAETRIEQLAALFDAGACRVAEKPFKLVLLARTAGAWWEELPALSGTAEILLRERKPEEMYLPVLEPGEAGRRTAYREAVDALARALPRVPGQEAHDWEGIAAGLTDPAAERLGNGSALTLHMTALADLLDTADPPGPDPGAARQSADGVEDRLLIHELRYWKRSAVSAGLLAPAEAVLGRTLTAALTAAFLFGAHGRSEAESLMAQLPQFADPQRLRDWLAGLYQPEFAGQVWSGLRPDRLAERYAGRSLAADPHLAGRFMAHCTDRQAAQLVTVYARAAAHPVFNGGLDDGLTALCTRHEERLTGPAMRTATRTERPGPLLDALWKMADRPGHDVRTLTDLSRRIPDRSQVLASWSAHVAHLLVLEYQRCAPVVPLPPGETWVSPGTVRPPVPGQAGPAARRGFIGPSVVVAADPESPGTLTVRAPAEPIGYLRALLVLTHRLDHAGQPDEAAEVSQEAMRFAMSALKVMADPQSVARHDTAAPELLADIADTLQTHAARAQMAGRQDEALAMAEPAVRLLRRLNEVMPGAVEEGPLRLALALGRLALIRQAAGQPERALADIAESNGMLWAMRRQRHPGTAHALAVGLSSQASLLAETGNRNEALRLARRAVLMHREGAGQDPDAHRPTLVAGLAQLADLLRDTEAQDEAAAVREQAVEQARLLVAANPAAHAGSLAAQLTAQAAQLERLQRYPEMVAALEEAVSVLRNACSVNPARYKGELAASLHVQGGRLTDAGQSEPARAAFAEAVAIRRELARESFLPHRVGLAESLVGLGRAVGTSGSAAEASAWIRKGLALLRRHERTRPDEAAWALAAALTNWSRVLARSGRHQAALGAATEAGTRYRGLIDRQRVAGESAGSALEGLTIALINQSAYHVPLEQYEEALAAASEAADLLRQPASAEPLAFLPYWASAQTNRGIVLRLLN